MRKSKINLMISREDYQKYELYFSWLKKSVFFLSGLFLLVFLAFFVLIKKKTDTNNSLTLQKKTFLESVNSKSGDEAKMYYVQKKYQDLTDFLKEDAYSLPYYTLLTDALKESSESSSLKSFAIDKKRGVDFAIVFNQFPELMNFFKFIESEAFLKNFENLTLKSFTVLGETTSQKENYELSFTGTFIPVKTDLINP